MSPRAPPPAHGRLAAVLKGRRISPLMLMGLAPLAASAAISALCAATAFFASKEIEADNSEWRPPAPSILAPAPSRPRAEDVHTSTRPLFVRSRRRNPPTVGEIEARSDAGGSAVTVMAIVRSGDASRAYLVGGGQAGEWYSVGQTIEGWTIAEIRASEVALASGARSAKVRLYPQSKE